MKVIYEGLLFGNQVFINKKVGTLISFLFLYLFMDHPHWESEVLLIYGCK